MSDKYALYVHGLGSGAGSGTRTSFTHCLPQYEWLCPEVSEYPEESLSIIDEYIRVFSPELIAGTSLGGLYSIYAHAPFATKVVCNATIGIEHILRKIGYGKHQFFCEREDKRTEYIIDEQLVRLFTEFKKNHEICLGVCNLGVFSTRDEIIGGVESRKNAKILEEFGFSIRWSDRFGHRINEQITKKIPVWLGELWNSSKV